MRTQRIKRMRERFMRKVQKTASLLVILIGFFTSIALKLNDMRLGGGQVTIQLPSVTLSTITVILTGVLIGAKIFRIIEENKEIDRKVAAMIANNNISAVNVVVAPEPTPVFKYSKTSKVDVDTDKRAAAKARREEQWRWGKEDILDCRAHKDEGINIYAVLENKNKLLAN